MLCRTLLAVASLLVIGAQAYAPIQMVSSKGKGLVVLPKGFPGNIRGALTPQKLTIRNPASNDSPSSIPYFTARLDQTITWDDLDWCLEATGSKHGDEVRVNSCSGAKTQKWNWIPDGRGHNLIQLRDTEFCLDVIDKEVGSNRAPIVLRRCGNQVAQWQFEEPLLIPGTSQGNGRSYESRHVMITVLILVGVGAVSLGAWIWQRGAIRNQDQKSVLVMMARDSTHPSRVTQACAIRTSSISMAEDKMNKGNQKQDNVPAVMAVNPVHPLHVAQTKASRSSDFGMAADKDMGIQAELKARMRAAMLKRAEGKPELDAVRLLVAAMITKQKETGLDALEDSAAIAVLKKQAKMRKDSIEMFEKAGRADKAASQKFELTLIEEYLPTMADDATVRGWVQEAIAEVCPDGPDKKLIGKVMGALNKAHGGEFDGKVASGYVKEMLAA